MSKEHEYRISLGDSHHGEVGICFSVRAECDEDAIEKARQALYALLESEGGIEIEDGIMPRGCYSAFLMLNPQHLTVNSITDEFEVGSFGSHAA